MNASDYFKYLLQAKTDKYNLLGILKQEGDYEKIRKIYKQISPLQFVKSVVNANAIPKDYKLIRQQRGPKFSNDFIGEATWTLITIEENKAIIQSFLDLKSKFENLFLLEQYEAAETVLDEIEESTGKSIWLIENRLLLNEYAKGVESNWNLLSELSKQIKDPVALFLLENLSKRAETKISYFRLRNIFLNQLQEINIDKEFFEYLCFRLNHIAYSDYESFAFMISAENYSALIDRYLLLKDIICELLDEKFVEKRSEIKLIANRLLEVFPEDMKLQQILCFINPSYISNISSNPKTNVLLSEYTNGNYQYCLNNAPQLIQSNPLIIEIYEIYIKSLIELEVPFSGLGFSKVIDHILQTLFNIFSNNSSFNQSFDSALKLSLAFFSTSWAKQFLSLIKSSSNSKIGSRQFSLDYILSSQIKNPRILDFVNQDDISVAVNGFSKDVELNNVINLIVAIIEGRSDIVQNAEGISERKRSIYYGRSLINQGRYNLGKLHFQNLLEQDNLSLISKEEAIINLFQCYLQLSMYKEACKLFVVNYLVNASLVKKLDKEKLLSLLESHTWENFPNFIELPIFVKVSSTDSYLQFVAYDVYLESRGLMRPTELFENYDEYGADIIFFLREVCSIEIMHHSYHFSGTDDIESERLNILNKLIVVDKINENTYIKEITELNQSSNIRRAMREVNKGRISVNVQQLKQNELPNIKEAFKRFKEIDSYSKHKEILGIDSSHILNEISNTMFDELVSNKVVFTNDPAFISFKVMFIELRDKYILSKEYGLDGYLSTRIRHGTLLNHIRSVFESQNIISQRDQDNNYLDNEFWNEETPLYLVDKLPKLQDAIKKFSREVDEYTESIIRDLIQVKTEKNNKKPKALFDYSVSNTELAYLFSIARENIKDHETFLAYVFEYLERQTEVILSRVRLLINNSIKNNYNKILQDFNDQIKEILGSLNFPELISSINLCGTRLLHELKNISEWFYLSNTSKDLILDLNVLIQTAVQITNTIYPSYKISPKINQNYEEDMVGTIHLIYVCRILLENIIKHSKLHSTDLDIEISSSVEDEMLKISFKNNLADEVDMDALNSKLRLVKEKWQNSSNDFENVDIEGNSGFDKIRRIIVFDLECEEYSFDYLIDESSVEVIIMIEFINIPKYAEQG